MRRLTPDQRESVLTEAMERPEYPWGLMVSLDSESLEKLNLAALPAVGETMIMTARVSVQSVSQHDAGMERRFNVELQITDMALERDNQQDAAEALYGQQ